MSNLSSGDYQVSMNYKIKNKRSSEIGTQGMPLTHRFEKISAGSGLEIHNMPGGGINH
jgi:hypothetical protein